MSCASDGLATNYLSRTAWKERHSHKESDILLKPFLIPVIYFKKIKNYGERILERRFKKKTFSTTSSSLRVKTKGMLRIDRELYIVFQMTQIEHQVQVIYFI